MRGIKIALLILCLFGGWHYSHAQAFSKLYKEGRPSMLFGSIQAVNSNFYVTGVTTSVRSPNYQKALLGKLSSSGDVEFINSIVDSDATNYDIFSNSLKSTVNGSLLTTGYKTDSLQSAFLMKTDANGHILLWHEYTELGNLIFQGADILEIPDSGYLLVINIERANHISNVLVIRTDTLGNVMNKSDYYLGEQSLPWVIKPMLNEHYLVGAFTGDPLNITPFWAKTWLIEVDRMGNRISDWIDTSTKNLWPNGMEQTADSGWIIVRQHLNYDISNVQAFNGSILKLDKDFNKEWEIDTGGVDYNTGMFDVKILSDGSYVCVGSNPFDTVLPGTAHDYGWLMKISGTGHIIWQRFYIPDDSYSANNYLNSVALMPDGGFAACGYTESDAYGQRAWIIRTDSMGCLLDNCGRFGTEVDEVNNNAITAEVFPNPSKNNFTIKLGLAPANDVYVNVYDLTGRLALHQPLTQQTTTIQNQLSSGMYLWQIQSNTGAFGAGKLVIEN